MDELLSLHTRLELVQIYVMSHVSGDETATTGVQKLRGDITVLFIGFMAGGCLE